MKAKYIILLVIMILLGLILLTSYEDKFGFVTWNTHKKYMVKLDTNSAKKILEVKTGPNGACKGNGCIYVPTNKQANITFMMVGTSKWYFKEIKICQGGTKPVSCSLEDWQQQEFEATNAENSFPKADGKIEFMLTDKLTSFVLHNYNSLPQEYFYIVTACKTIDDNETCYSTDPPVINKGRS